MKHHEIDPSLRAAERPLDSLADGFSPPGDAHAQPKQEHGHSESSEVALPPKSPF